MKEFDDIHKIFKFLNFRKVSSFRIPVNLLEDIPNNSSLERDPRVDGRVPLSSFPSRLS
ncbi:hypothetical protein KSP39_PZI013177 [Platanthera zijinensis]|uniref:Uncharacterized protein n=1 Tax=Platanthera zijinensis TaxID=2320716 RepID=A0AAP0BCF6_9ASPA